MDDNDELPKRDWSCWLLFALCAYGAVKQFLQFLESTAWFSLIASIGLFFMAIALLFNWPFRRAGESPWSMERSRFISFVLTIMGGALLLVGGFGILATR